MVVNNELDLQSQSENWRDLTNAPKLTIYAWIPSYVVPMLRHSIGTNTHWAGSRCSSLHDTRLFKL
jgi:hypothetical protein